MKKVCTKCKIEKNIEEFTIRCKDTGSIRADCKECCKKQRNKWRKNNKEYDKKQRHQWREDNKEKTEQYYIENKERILKYNKQWRKNNKEKTKERMKVDVNFKLNVRLRSRLWNAIKRNWKSGSAVRDLGCSIEEVKQHLESQFKPGMTWDNWTLNGWHIDHIIPLSYFDLADRKQLLKAVHYTNLQPLWAKENLKKGAKYDN